MNLFKYLIKLKMEKQTSKIYICDYLLYNQFVCLCVFNINNYI